MCMALREQNYGIVVTYLNLVWYITDIISLICNYK